jgi:hypothetical protein
MLTEFYSNQEKDPLMELVYNNLSKRVGTAPFKSTIERHKSSSPDQKSQRTRVFRIPPPGFYDANFDAIESQRQKSFDFTKK